MKKLIFALVAIALVVGLAATYLKPGLKPGTPQTPALLHEAERELAVKQTSVYKHHINVDETVGRFNYDCSGFVDYALNRIAPEAYAELPISKPRFRRPLAQDYYLLFSRPIPNASHWTPIFKASQVRAGDIVAWLRPPDIKTKNTGHVMVIQAQPRASKMPHEWLIPVIDSLKSPHAQDSRHHGQTGLGSGVIGVMVNRHDEPIAYRWHGGTSKRIKKTAIAFGRLSG